MKKLEMKLMIGCALISLFITMDSALAAPPNDNCASATPIGEVTNLAFDTSQATQDGTFMPGPNIWYVYTPTCTGGITISLCGSSYDTQLAVYNSTSCPPSPLNRIRCNDDYPGCGSSSEVNFYATAGSHYLFEVGGYSGTDKGTGKINISCNPKTAQPSNNNCNQAKVIIPGNKFAFDISYANFDGSGVCMSGPNIWYIYSALYSSNITVSLCGSSYDTMLAVYNSGSCYPPPSSLIECNDDFCGLASQITFAAVAGHQYLIEVGGFGCNVKTGDGFITMTSDTTPPTPSNDNCTNAAPIGNVTNQAFDTTTATFDGPGLCVTGPNIWYLYTATCTNQVTVSLCGSSFDTVLAVYKGSECYPAPADLIGCNDDSCNKQSEVTFAAVIGHQYLIEVGGFGSQAGPGVITISCGSPSCVPTNDDCQNAKPVGNVTNLAFDTTCATFDGPGLCMTSPNIWYCYTATCTGTVTVSLCGSQFDTKLAVYKGCGCNPAMSDLISCNDDFCDYQSELTFAAVIGHQYLIEVGGFGNQTGVGVLTITCGGITPVKTDLGDAPDSTNNAHKVMTAYPVEGALPAVNAHYPTVFNDGTGLGPFGPIHTNTQLVAYLGKKITRETEADKNTDEDGVNNINPNTNTADKDGGDDGVVFPVNMPSCRWTTFKYTVNVVTPGTDLWVNVWCDWNRDGDWDDTLTCACGPAPEWAVQNQFLYNLPPGLNEITTPAFLSFKPQNSHSKIWMRITLSEKPFRGGDDPNAVGNGGSGPESGYAIGETEDYYFTPGTQDCTVCQDLNGDGLVDSSDLSLLVQSWLANCQSQ
jgi:hypothetical protein